MFTKFSRHQVCHFSNCSKTYNISRRNPKWALPTLRNPYFHSHTLSNSPPPCTHTENGISLCTWTRWSSSLCFYEHHCWWSSRSPHDDVYWQSCKELKDIPAVKRVGSVREGMHSKVVFRSWRTIFHPPHPHTWRNNYIWHHSRTSELQALHSIPTWNGCECGHKSSLMITSLKLKKLFLLDSSNKPVSWFS